MEREVESDIGCLLHLKKKNYTVGMMHCGIKSFPSLILLLLASLQRSDY